MQVETFKGWLEKKSSNQNIPSYPNFSCVAAQSFSLFFVFIIQHEYNTGDLGGKNQNVKWNLIKDMNKLY